MAGDEIEVPDALPRAGNGQRQPFLALAQLRLGARPRGDVAHHQLHFAVVERR